MKIRCYILRIKKIYLELKRIKNNSPICMQIIFIFTFTDLYIYIYIYRLYLYI